MQERVIKNTRGLALRENFKELYEFRELLWILAWRDFRVRYAQTFLGLAWAVIEPFITAVLLSLVFNKVANASTQGLPPILFGMVGMIGWNYFSNVVNQGNVALLMAQNMVKKIYFPRMIIPLSKAIAALPDLLITIVFTAILMIYYQPSISINTFLLPIFILMTVLTAAGLGLWLSALNIRYRDFKHVVPFLIRIGLFLTPIAYSTSEISAQYKWLFFLNPMTGIIEGMRWALFGLPVDWALFSISMSMSVLLLIGGFVFFSSMQKLIADII